MPCGWYILSRTWRYLRWYCLSCLCGVPNLRYLFSRVTVMPCPVLTCDVFESQVTVTCCHGLALSIWLSTCYRNRPPPVIIEALRNITTQPSWLSFLTEPRVHIIMPCTPNTNSDAWDFQTLRIATTILLGARTSLRPKSLLGTHYHMYYPIHFPVW